MVNADALALGIAADTVDTSHLYALEQLLLVALRHLRAAI